MWGWRILPVIVGSLILVSGVARAAGWSPVTPPPFGDLGPGTGPSGVSCASGGPCTVVGDGPAGPLAAGWNGSDWTAESLPSDQSSKLAGISCPSMSDCVAVGEHSGSLSPYLSTVYVVRWNGVRWSVQDAPSPPGADAGLTSVSCASSTACIGVGNISSVTGADQTFAELWDGAGWSIVSTPNPVGTTSSDLYSVSCASSAACTAVGSYWAGTADTGHPATLAERWDGKRWSLQATPNPSNGGDVSLYGVSCASRTACVAVGKYSMINNTIEATLAERWDGRRWSLQPTPDPAGAAYDALGGVACPSSRLCTAVGVNDTFAGSLAALAERWDGVRWSLVPTPHVGPQGADNELKAVSCTNVKCVAVGSIFSPFGRAALALVEPRGSASTTTIASDTVSGVKVAKDGTATFSIQVPGRGRIDVLETAWIDNFSTTHLHADVSDGGLLQPAKGRFVVARSRALPSRAGIVRVSVTPNRRGRLLVAHHSYPVVLRLWVSFTRTAGRTQTIGFYGLHLARSCPQRVASARARTKVNCERR